MKVILTISEQIIRMANEREMSVEELLIHTLGTLEQLSRQPKGTELAFCNPQTKVLTLVRLTRAAKPDKTRDPLQLVWIAPEK